MHAGERLAAPRTSAIRLGDGDGTQLTLEPGASLTVVEAGATRRFALHEGAVRAHVRKLLAGQRFIIDTADAEIEVHGTEFRVVSGGVEAAPAPCPGQDATAAIATRVSVSEGVVAVTWAGHQQRLLPGDEWPARCAAAAAPPETEADRPSSSPPRNASNHPVAATAMPRRAAGAGPRAGHVTPAPERQLGASALEAENNLFLSAVRARKSGRNAEALELFSRFIHEHPGAPLFESALAQKMRLLAATDARRAADAARQYLATFPDGFARDEARSLLVAPSPP
jgi:hypothetical protein